MKWTLRAVWTVVGVGIAFYLALTFWLVFRAILFPYVLDYGEGDVFWFTLKLARGMNIYTTLASSPPFDSANYPPVAMLLTAVMVPLFGVTLTFGRWLNFAAALILAAFIIRLVRARTNNPRLAFLMAGLFLGSTFVYHWLPLYRVDLVGVAFSFAGIFCVRRWQSRQRTTDDERRTLVLLGGAILFFLLALYTKQSLFVAPTAATLAIFLRNQRAGILFALALGALGGAVFLLLEILTQGGWSFGILALNATVWTPRVFVPLLTSFLVTYAVVLVFATVGWFARVRAKHFGVLEIYALVSVLSLALAGREGAWENYFLETIAVACVFAGVGIHALETLPRLQWVIPVLLLAQLALFWNEHDPRLAQKLFDEVRAGNEHVAPLIQNTTGTVIAEDMGLLWGNGKPVTYYSFVYSTLARAGRYDQKWEVENLRAGNFPLVILNRGTREDVDAFGNFTHAFVSALDYGYAMTGADARYVVYEPAPLAHFGPRVTLGDTFELVGWSLAPDELRGGEEMVLSIVWRAAQKPTARFTTFAHLETEDGAKLAQDDHEPLNGIYPTPRWAQDEMVRETYRLRLPRTVPAGEYVLRVGWYDTLTQDRLSAADNRDVIELKNFAVR